MHMNNGHAYVTDLVGIVWSSTPGDWGSTDTDRSEYNSVEADTWPDLKYIQHCADYVHSGTSHTHYHKGEIESLHDSYMLKILPQ